MRWIDDHCHLHRDVAIADEQVAAAAEAGVERLITVGCDVGQSADYIDIARRHPGGCGPPPACTPTTPRTASAGSRRCSASPRWWRWGSAGSTSTTTTRPATQQAEVFAAQIALAHAHDLTLVIHTREAWPETFDILAAEGVPARTVFHCFTGGPDEARRCLDLGAVLSFSGIVSFPSATDLHDAARLCPLDRLLVETDSPYLAPVPHRGKKNQPAWVVDVGTALAAREGRRAGRCRRSTWGTAHATYRLPPG